jgi:hypothetical protein
MNANERELILEDEVYQYKEDPIMEANECKSREFISVYSRAFAVDYIRG